MTLYRTAGLMASDAPRPYRNRRLVQLLRPPVLGTCFRQRLAFSVRLVIRCFAAASMLGAASARRPSDAARAREASASLSYPSFSLEYDRSLSSSRSILDSSVSKVPSRLSGNLWRRMNRGSDFRISSTRNRNSSRAEYSSRKSKSSSAICCARLSTAAFQVASSAGIGSIGEVRSLAVA